MKRERNEEAEIGSGLVKWTKISWCFQNKCRKSEDVACINFRQFPGERAAEGKGQSWSSSVVRRHITGRKHCGQVVVSPVWPLGHGFVPSFLPCNSRKAWPLVCRDFSDVMSSKGTKSRWWSLGEEGCKWNPAAGRHFPPADLMQAACSQWA